MISDSHRKFYNENGYVVVEKLLSPDEAAFFRDHFMELRETGNYPGDMVADTKQSRDPLKRYPRMIQMHNWDDTSLRWMLDERINQCLTTLLEREPFAVQTMLYFKPPKARGQALHQDNFYLKAQPGTCMAAWLALDPCDEANGCMQVVPGSHRWPILCTQKADTKTSFTDVTVPIPEGQKVEPVFMQPGDTLFFHGSLVHGSFPNSTTNRFRRALIGHYIEGNSQKYNGQAWRMDGTPVRLAPSDGGGLCGVWVDEDGTPVIEVVGKQLASALSE
ncbi:MAG: phytanoyl-CoA dioxygenase family protein [Abitibacteriaceae bacterium]|nr:phytanoyl-CoA dioxygenase family protein [Abditibacteriaceae bacterium]